MSNEAIFKGDDTAAFGGTFLTIKVSNPELYPISKILFVVNGGAIKKEFTDADMFQVEETILTVNFDSKETAILQPNNIGNLVVYDEYGKQETCKEYVQFQAQTGVICNAKQCCC